jgi:RNA 3'-terminal phosphate cyclase
MALAEGKSSFKTGPITLHTQTAIHIAEKLTNVSISKRLQSTDNPSRQRNDNSFH